MKLVLLSTVYAHGPRVDIFVHGMNAVTAAAQNGQLAALRLCLAAPGGAAAVDMLSGGGSMALALAAANGCTAEARLLLEHGADPNLCENDGDSPLICAAQAPGDAGLGAAALLLDAKADVDHPNNDGQTALQFACQASNVKVAELLLERGANKNLRMNGDYDAKYIVEAINGPRKEELLALLARY